jgi:hypothetical protein
VDDPAGIDGGSTLETEGAGFTAVSTLNVSGPATPPPGAGLMTDTCIVPGTNSVPEMFTVIDVGDTVRGECGLAPNEIMLVGLKLLPLSVRVNSLMPA